MGRLDGTICVHVNISTLDYKLQTGGCRKILSDMYEGTRNFSDEELRFIRTVDAPSEVYFHIRDEYLESRRRLKNGLRHSHVR